MIILRNIKLKYNHPKDAIRIEISKRLGKNISEFQIYKRSIDSRKGLFFVYQVLVDMPLTDRLKKKLKQNIDAYEESRLDVELKNISDKEVVIVGSGPAGLFCAYFLSKYGTKVHVIERGKSVKERAKDVDQMLVKGILQPESNVQYGEGGAGTFSDGKLTSRSKSPRIYEVLKTFVAHGADPSILYEQKPHIGTDVLREVITSMRREIEKNGGIFSFSTRFEDFSSKKNRVIFLQTNRGRFSATDFVLALGNSARDTFAMLSDKLTMENKNFAVGFRIEHPQELVEKNQYHDAKGENLPRASYSLTENSGKHGVYTFCMCPGGYVIAASSEEKRLCVNGMSYHARDGANANSALVVSVDENVFGHQLLDGLRFQRTIEEKAYRLGQGSFFAPVQRVEDFLKTRKTTSFGTVTPTYRPGVTFSDLNEIYPKDINDDIKNAIGKMEKKMPGFSMKDAILTGAETRTSSPVRIVRNKNFTSVDFENLYAIGEGAGYSGGIVSSAIDGLQCALEILKK